MLDCYTHAPLESIFVCPHRDLMPSLEGNRIPDVCYDCGTKVEWCPGSSKSSYPLKMDVTRALGRCDWRADRRWFKQCRITGNSSYSYSGRFTERAR